MTSPDIVHTHVTMPFSLDFLQVHVEQGREELMQLHHWSFLPLMLESHKVD